ncbi:MAG: hypothetical protein ACFBZ8_09605 [Opitutales bacterium]
MLPNARHRLTRLFLAGAVLSFPFLSQAQEGGGAPAPTQNQQFFSGERMFESDTFSEFAGGAAYDPQSDSLDLEEGTLQWKGRTFNLGNNRLIRARFERYLSTPTYADGGDEYAAILDRISELLSVSAGSGDTESIDEAWNLLFRAGKYPIDGGNALIIANQVFNAWRIRAQNQDGQFNRNELDRLRKHQQSIVSNRAWLEEARARDIIERNSGGARDARLQRLNQGNSGGGGQQPNDSGNQQQSEEESRNGSASITPDGIEIDGGSSSSSTGLDGVAAPAVVAAAGTSQAAFDVAQLAHIEAQIQALSATMAVNAMQAKLQFQTQFVTFLKQRRYQHALITAAFYRHIFGGAHQGLDVGRSQLTDFIDIADIVPTIDVLEGFAREAIADTAVGMESVNHLFQTGERFGAMQRLQETFFLGEYLPRVVEYDPAKKAVLLKLFQNTRALQRVLDIKDFDRAEAILTDIQEVASDFPSDEIQSGINTRRQASNLAVITAQGARETGNFDRAEEKIKEAIEFWPLNPRIEDFLSNSVAQANFGNQAVAKFDEAYEDGAFRLIQKEAPVYGIALGQDPERADKVREVVTLMGKIDGFISQAESMVDAGLEYSAFELLLKAEALRPEDPEVAKAISQVARRVPEYAALLHDAKVAESNGRAAHALNLYLAGRKLNQASEHCLAGIERTSQELMQSLQADQPPSILGEEIEEAELDPVDPFATQASNES